MEITVLDFMVAGTLLGLIIVIIDRFIDFF